MRSRSWPVWVVTAEISSRVPGETSTVGPLSGSAGVLVLLPGGLGRGVGSGDGCNSRERFRNEASNAWTALRNAVNSFIADRMSRLDIDGTRMPANVARAATNNSLTTDPDEDGEEPAASTGAAPLEPVVGALVLTLISSAPSPNPHHDTEQVFDELLGEEKKAQIS